MGYEDVAVQINIVSFEFGAPGVGERERYTRALRAELASAGDYADTFAVDTLCVTGSHPLQYQGTALAEDIKTLRKFLPFRGKAEITVNALPGSVTLADLTALVGQGVKRISFDVRSFVQTELDALGRGYSPRAVEVFMRMVQRRMVFFDFDVTLHYGLAGQTLESFRYSMGESMRSMCTHFTLLPAEDADPGQMDGFYQAALDVLAGTNFEQYTAQHFGRPGNDSRWNRQRYASQARLGFGAGVVSKIEGMRCENTMDVVRYMAAEGSPAETIARAEAITAGEMERAAVLDGLYTLRGCEVAGLDDAMREKVEGLCEREWLAREGEKVTLTVSGKAHWREVEAGVEE
jgi:oxygen-independent coproporphyrinogen III oxidase